MNLRPKLLNEVALTSILQYPDIKDKRSELGSVTKGFAIFRVAGSRCRLAAFMKLLWERTHSPPSKLLQLIFLECLGEIMEDEKRGEKQEEHHIEEPLSRRKAILRIAKALAAVTVAANLPSKPAQANPMNLAYMNYALYSEVYINYTKYKEVYGNYHSYHSIYVPPPKTK